MARKKINSFFLNKRGEGGEHQITKHIIYWALIIVCAIIMWVIVNGIIHKLLVLY